MTGPGTSADPLPRTMKGVQLVGHGGLDRLVLATDIPVPQPAPGEVLIQVSACGVNNTDINTRLGWYAPDVDGATDEATGSAGDGAWGSAMEFPRIQGADVVGVVVALGDDVASPPAGTRVIVDPWLRAERRSDTGYLGSESDGGFAEYVTVPAINAHAISSPLSDVELATFPCSYSTAEHMLERTRVGPGQRVLVTGASGGVGTGLVQIARARGASVVAVASGSKAAAVERLGADAVIDRTAGELAAAVKDAGPFDVLADVVGGPDFGDLLDAVVPGGHCVISGAVAGPIVPLDLRTIYLHDLTIHGATMVPVDVFARLLRRIQAGEIRPLVAGTFPLENVARAQDELARRQHVGSFVVKVR